MTRVLDSRPCSGARRAHRLIRCACFSTMLALAWHLQNSASIGEGLAPATSAIYCDHPQLVFAPYAWKRSGQRESSHAEATMPGAYLRASIAGTSRIELLVDGQANRGCPEPSLPLVEVSIDDGEFQTLALKPIPKVYSLVLSDKLDPNRPHTVAVYCHNDGSKTLAFRRNL